MGNRIFVGNLPFNATREQLSALFAEIGQVVSSEIVTDRATGRPRGFGFIEMASPELAMEAVAVLHRRRLGGRLLSVAPARDRTGDGALT